jgi:hypothetical protein
MGVQLSLLYADLFRFLWIYKPRSVIAGLYGSAILFIYLFIYLFVCLSLGLSTLSFIVVTLIYIPTNSI